MHRSKAPAVAACAPVWATVEAPEQRHVAASRVTGRCGANGSCRTRDAQLDDCTLSSSIGQGRRGKRSRCGRCGAGHGRHHLHDHRPTRGGGGRARRHKDGRQPTARLSCSPQASDLSDPSDGSGGAVAFATRTVSSAQPRRIPTARPRRPLPTAPQLQQPRPPPTAP